MSCAFTSESPSNAREEEPCVWSSIFSSTCVAFFDVLALVCTGVMSLILTQTPLALIRERGIAVRNVGLLIVKFCVSRSHRGL